MCIGKKRRKKDEKLKAIKIIAAAVESRGMEVKGKKPIASIDDGVTVCPSFSGRKKRKRIIYYRKWTRRRKN